MLSESSTKLFVKIAQKIITREARPERWHNSMHHYPKLSNLLQIVLRKQELKGVKKWLRWDQCCMQWTWRVQVNNKSQLVAYQGFGSFVAIKDMWIIYWIGSDTIQAIPKSIMISRYRFIYRLRKRQGRQSRSSILSSNKGLHDRHIDKCKF